MSAFDSLVKERPRDVGGPTAENRLEYQLNWGLKKLLMLQESAEPYTIIFDLHDDILVLDSDTNPTCIDFYQVKTTSNGHWTPSKLLTINEKKKTETPKKEVQLDLFKDNPDSKPKHSKIGNLMRHSLIYDEARDYYFVTNAGLSDDLIPEDQDDKEEILFKDLNPEIKRKFYERLKKELKEVDEKALERLHFIKGQMAVHDYEETVIGIVSKFLKNHLKLANMPPEPIYECLIAEIRKRNKNEIKPGSVEELLKTKAFTKKDFEEFLTGVKNLKNFEERKTRIQQVLLQFNPNEAITRRCIMRELENVRVATLTYDNNDLYLLHNSLTKTMDKMSGKDINEWQWCNLIYDKLIEEYPNFMNHSEDYLKCLILYEICNY
jgi:CRISPR/Cas system-associated exonuclease Cas4 (RecB family)